MPNFTTAGPISVVFDIPAGRVQVVAADRADTTVEVVAMDALKSRDVKAAEQTQVVFGGDVLQVKSPMKNQAFGPSGAVAVTVHLPAGSRVEGKAASAEFLATGRLGEVVFDGAHGEVSIDEAASVRVTAHAGDIVIGRLGGSAEISTAKGDIRIGEAVAGTVVLGTQAGDITVGAAAGVSASLDAGTGHGRVENSLKNSGTTELAIRATTSYGDIAARSL